MCKPARAGPRGAPALGFPARHRGRGATLAPPRGSGAKGQEGRGRRGQTQAAPRGSGGASSTWAWAGPGAPCKPVARRPPLRSPRPVLACPPAGPAASAPPRACLGRRVPFLSCCHRLPSTWWLKTTHVHPLSALAQASQAKPRRGGAGPSEPSGRTVSGRFQPFPASRVTASLASGPSPWSRPAARPRPCLCDPPASALRGPGRTLGPREPRVVPSQGP